MGRRPARVRPSGQPILSFCDVESRLKTDLPSEAEAACTAQLAARLS